MTPDDMEGRTLALAAWLDSSTHEPWAFSSVQAASDLRALLLDYQERGRALDGINQMARDQLALIPPDLVHGGVVGELLLDILGRAMPTLKGKSHD
jgi:hypothetical protein